MEACKIQTRAYFTGNALFHPAYSELSMFNQYTDPAGMFPVATKTTNDTFFLGVYPGITDEQIDYIGRMVDKFFDNL